jgi:hypothetical protein
MDIFFKLFFFFNTMFTLVGLLIGWGHYAYEDKKRTRLMARCTLALPVFLVGGSTIVALCIAVYFSSEGIKHLWRLAFPREPKPLAVEKKLDQFDLMAQKEVEDLLKKGQEVVRR